MQIKNEKDLKIGVVKTDNIGDAVLASPFFFELRKHFNKAHITAYLSHAGKEVLDGLKLFDEIKTINPLWLSYNKTPFVQRIASALGLLSMVNKEKFDVLIGMRYQDRLSSLVLSLSNAKNKIGYDVKGMGFGIRNKISMPDKKTHEIFKHLAILKYLGIEKKSKVRLGFSISEESEKKAKEVIKEYKIKKYIVIHPVSGHISKDWGIDRFKALATGLSKKYKVIIAGLAEDKGINDIKGKNIFNLAGKLNIKELGSIIKNSLMVIGGDSAGVHIGQAFNRKTLTIFSGAAYYEGWMAFGKKSFIIFKDTDCRGCELIKCKREHECLNISVSYVIKIAEKILKDSQKEKIIKA